MRFPKFIPGMKQHMPFIGKINDKPEFLVCMAEMESKYWKIYRYTENWGYTRLTNAPDNVIECNPSVEQDGNKIFYSWSYQDDSNVGSGVVKEISTGKFDLFSNKLTFDFEEYSKYEKRPYGIYHGGNFYDRINMKEKLGVDLVLHLQVYSENELIITYVQENVKKSGIYDISKNEIVRDLKDLRDRWLYKPCCYENEWFGVITIKGTNPENRYVVPIKMEK